MAHFPRFIIIEFLENVSPFLIEKVIATSATPKQQKTPNRNLLVEVPEAARKHPTKQNLHSANCKAYPHERLNTLKGVVGSRELALATTKDHPVGSLASRLGL